MDEKPGAANGPAFPQQALGHRSDDLFLGRVAQTIAAYRMLAPGDRVLVAVSGGPDSVALWRALGSLAGPLRLTLGMVHINYHLRAAESEEDERFCRALAAESGARIFVCSCSRPGAGNGSFNLQAWARRTRYGLFGTIAEAEEYRCIAIGHHYDDQVETIAAGWLGGRTSFAIGGIPRVRGRIIRPLFDCRRADILEFLRHLGQPFCEDRSNRDHRFQRNRIRHEVLPRMRKAAYPHVDDVLFRWADVAAGHDARLGGIADRWLEGAVMDAGEHWVSLDLNSLQQLDRRLDFFVLRQAATRIGKTAVLPGMHTVRRFGELIIAGRPGTKLVWAHTLAEVSRRAVTLYFQLPGQPAPVVVKSDDVTIAPGWGMQLTCSSHERRGDERIQLGRGAWRCCGDAEMIRPPVLVRGPRPGERIRPLGMAGQRKIADLLAQAGVPVLLRGCVPVLEDQRGIFWVVGHHLDDRVKVTARTRQLMTIEVKRWPGREGSCPANPNADR